MSKKDGFIWARIDVDLFQHPKFIGLPPEAVCLWLKLVLYARKQQTDGRIPADIVEYFAKDCAYHWRKIIDTLCGHSSKIKERLKRDCPPQSRTDHPLLSYQNGHYVLHDFLKYQESKLDITTRKEHMARMGRKSAEARKRQHNVERHVTTPRSTEIETEIETELIKEKNTKKETTQPTHQNAPKGACELPADFTITKAMRQWATKNLPAFNLDEATAEWADYWHSKGGRKKDWTAAWRNGMRKYVEWGKHLPNQNMTPRDRRIAQVISNATTYDQTHNTPPFGIIEGGATAW